MKKLLLAIGLVLTAQVEATASPQNSLSGGNSSSSQACRADSWQNLGKFNLSNYLFFVSAREDHCLGTLALNLSFGSAALPSPSVAEQDFEVVAILKNRTTSPSKPVFGNYYFNMCSAVGCRNTKIFLFEKEGLQLSDCARFEIRVAGKLHFFPIDP